MTKGEKMILAWQPPIYYSDELIGSYDLQYGSYDSTGSNFRYLSLLAGEKYPAEMDCPPVYFKCKKEKLLNYDCLWLLGGVPLVSARLADLLAKETDQEIEFIVPKRISADGKPVSELFYIVNPINTVNVVDQDQSIAETDDNGAVIYYTKIWFRDEGLAPRKIAREAESSDLLISEELANLIKANKFKCDGGLGFYRADRTYIPIPD